MKKIFLIIGIILSFLAITVNSNATCYNWIGMNLTFTYNGLINNEPVSCEVFLSYEYCCEATGFGFGIRITGFHYIGDCDLPIDNDFWNQATQAMLLDFVNKVNCIQPCSSENWTQHIATIKIPKCWKMINDPVMQECRIEACPSSTECVYTYKVCYYYDENNNIQLDFVLDGMYIIPGNTCTIIGPPEFTGDPNIYWESECFIYSNDCPILQ